MSEEEIMQGINRTIAFMKEELNAEHSCFTIKELWSLNGLVELYNKEKEKNNQKYYHNIKCRELEKETNKEWEDKIRKKIKELEDNMILFTNDKEKFNKYKYARDVLEKLLKENE